MACRMTQDALEVLREAAEVHMSQMFNMAKELTHHAHRATLLPKDIEALLRYVFNERISVIVVINANDVFVNFRLLELFGAPPYWGCKKPLTKRPEDDEDSEEDDFGQSGHRLCHKGSTWHQYKEAMYGDRRVHGLHGLHET